MSKSSHPFLGRTVNVVNDLTIDEQIYLYKKSSEIKRRLRNGETAEDLRLGDNEFGAYLMFFENSTRTKESFRNAVKFHKMKLNNFEVSTSSVNKKESLIDTMKMLYGYSHRSLFIVRSKTEGVCRALEEVFQEYSAKTGLPPAAFLNAGDGKHEHPTQEFLDEFSFLEKKSWKRDSIHIALIGDLFHGRTVHSKTDGLRIFKSVKVDLIAPEELALPKGYSDKMIRNGFELRSFSTLDEYLERHDCANIWYFTRLQLERMGDDILGKSHLLRKAVTFREDMIEKLPLGTKFYHPLPRHQEFPVIPVFLDKTDLNGWDEQSINGYYTRIALVGMASGAYGEDFVGEVKTPDTLSSDFIQRVKIVKKSKVIDRYKVGIKPVDEGIVIDHICRGKDLEEIWNTIEKIRKILRFNCRSSHGVFHTNDRDFFKGIISLPDIIELNEKELKKLSAIAPGCTVNIIQDQSVKDKFRLSMPPRIYNFEEISCKNEQCISHPKMHENVLNDFIRIDKSTFKCKYCEKNHTYQEIWDY